MDNPLASILAVIFMIGGAYLARMYFGETILVSMIGGAVGGGVGGLIGATLKEIANKLSSRKSDNLEGPESHKINLEKYQSNAEVSATAESTVIEPTKKVEPFYYGFGGWLYLFTIGQLYSLYNLAIGIKDNFAVISSSDITTLRDNGYDDFADRFLIMSISTIFFSVIMIGLVIISWFFLVRLSKRYKTINITYILINFISVIFLTAFMIYINYYAEEEIYLVSDYIGYLIGAAIYLGIWLPYFLKSKRVSNTFNR